MVISPTVVRMGVAAIVLALGGCDRAAPPATPSAPAPATPSGGAADGRVARFNKGVGLMGTFSFEDAEAIFAPLAAADPADRSARLDLAISVLNQTAEGAQERALKLLDELLAGDPNDVRAHYCSGLVQLFLGNPDAALRHF